MTAPSYTTDLTLLDDAADDTDWGEPTATGWTSLFAVTSADPDNVIEGTTCNSATFKTGVGGFLYDSGSGQTIPTDGAFLIWICWGTPKSLGTKAQGGIRTIIGLDQDNFKAWIHGGVDTYIYGGWLNLATNPTITADYTEGSPGTTYQWFGAAFNALTVPFRGNPCFIDACRFGRCEARFAYGDSNGYATFSGFATINDTNDIVDGYNRWGLLQEIPGGFLWKGLMTLGYVNAVDFRDSNTLILVDDTQAVTSGFNQINIEQAGSNVEWNSISFKALGTTSKGNFEMVANATVNFISCTFTSMGTFTFDSSATINTSIFRTCELVTQGGATFTGCTFASSEATTSMLSDNPSVVINCTFQCDSTSNHAIELTTACAGNSYDLTGHIFEDYALYDGSTGDEVIFNDSSGVVTLNASGISGTISVRNGVGASTIVVSSVPITITVQDKNTDPILDVQVGIYKISDRTEIMNEDTIAGGIASEGYGGATPVNVEIRCRKASSGASKYKNFSTLGEINSNGLTLLVTMDEDTNNNAIT